MSEVRIPEALWRSTMAPCGQVRRWRVEDGETVEAGAPLADVVIEDAVHEITAPIRGRFRFAPDHGPVVEPGGVIGYIEA